MIKKCLVCGKTFKFPPGRKNTAKFCSNPCRHKGIEDNKITKALEEYKMKLCACGCGEYLNPSRKVVGDALNKGIELRYKHHHFSKTEEARAKCRRGKNHPMFGRKGILSPVWKGGIKKRVDYGDSWYYQRKKARRRDNYTCKECGATRDERRLDVHHIIPFKEFDSSKKANRLSNLICLCYKCHMLKEWEIREKRMNSGKLLRDNPEPS